MRSADLVVHFEKNCNANFVVRLKKNWKKKKFFKKKFFRRKNFIKKIYIIKKFLKKIFVHKKNITSNIETKWENLSPYQAALTPCDGAERKHEKNKKIFENKKISQKIKKFWKKQKNFEKTKRIFKNQKNSYTWWIFRKKIIFNEKNEKNKKNRKKIIF